MNYERLKSAMATAGISQSELARRVNVTQGAINQLVNGISRSTRHLPQIARELNVSIAWLLDETDDPSPDAPSPTLMAELEEALGVTRVPRIDVGYAMGAGTVIEDYPDTELASLDTTWLRRITRSPAEMLFIGTGIGDSMMTTLLDADTLIFDRAQKRINQQDRIWAIAYGELGMVKRVRSQPNGTFLIISDNPAVENFEVGPEDFHVIAKLVGILRAM